MSVMLTLGRSEALPNVPEGIAGSVVTLGPFEYVELTYNILRVGPDGNAIGYFEVRDGTWRLNDDRYPFSDLDIHATESS